MTETVQPAVNAGQIKKGRFQLILMLVIFALPPVAAYLAYFNNWIPKGRTNKCELIQPAQPVTGLSFRTLDGGSLSMEDLKGQWVFLSAAGNPCDDSCRKAIYNMRQIRTALADGKQYVERVVVLPGAMPKDDLETFLKDYPGMHVIVGNDEALARLVSLLPRPAVGEGAGDIYVIDPLGNLMMHYSAEQNPRGLLLDMQHLLKVTQFH